VLPLRPHLTCTALQQRLRRSGSDGLADVLSSRPSTLDGLRRDPAADALSAWRTTALAGGEPGPHPAMFHDRGVRLASQLQLEVVALDRHQLLNLLVVSLDHLADARSEPQQPPQR